RPGRHYGEAREVLLVLGLRDGEALDVVASPREHAGNACKHAGLVVDEDRQRMRLGRLLALLHEISGAWLVVLHGSSLGPCARGLAAKRVLFPPCRSPRWHPRCRDPVPAASRCAPCRMGSSGSSWQAPPHGNRTAPVDPPAPPAWP